MAAKGTTAVDPKGDVRTTGKGKVEKRQDRIAEAKAAIEKARKDPYNAIVLGMRDQLTNVVDSYAQTSKLTPEQEKFYTQNKIVSGDDAKSKDLALRLTRQGEAISAMGKRAVKDAVTIGHLLTQAQIIVGHGAWSAYVQNVLGMDVQKVQRLQASAKALTLYPELQTVLHRIPETALARIGASKDTTKEGVQDLVEYLSEEEAGKATVTTAEIVARAAPGKGQGKKAMPTIPFVQVEASIAQELISRLAGQLASFQSSGIVNGDQIKDSIGHPLFTKWVKDTIGGTDALGQAITATLVACWGVSASAYPSDDWHFARPVMEGETVPENEATPTADDDDTLDLF